MPIGKIEKILITGGAGFIGSNLANFYIKKGVDVIIFDNLSREGTNLNLSWLKRKYPAKFSFVRGDIRNYNILRNIFKKHKNIDVVFHEAAQVSVMESIANPRLDFETNLLGTFNLLEVIRQFSKNTILVYASTNKVYGNLKNIKGEEIKNGISELRNLNFYSPYGCSKGASDQYVRDYSRTYGLRTIVFRQSCIYGERQMGEENQGWLSWFVICFLSGRRINIYGTGRQVRDVLFIDDLVRAYDMAIKKINITNSKIYNIGGGSTNSLSILKLLELLEKNIGRRVEYKFLNSRPGDQQFFISDNSLSRQDFGWEPKVSFEVGLKRLVKWLRENQTVLKL